MQDQEAEIKARLYARISGGRVGDRYELASKTLRTWRRYDCAEATCEV
jgi:hypothetical protein